MAVTLSTVNKSTHIVLSNGNLTATADTSGPGPFNGRCDTTISGSQRISWRATCNVQASGNQDGLGFANASWTFTDNAFIGGDTFSLGYYATGGVFVNFVLLATIATWSAGQTFDIALDRGADKVWYSLDGGTTWNNDVIGNQNPAVGSQIGGITTGITGALMPGYGAAKDTGGVDTQWTFNFLTPFVPTGFTALDGDVLMGQAVM
jgi:hypothetical protein